MTTSTKTFGPCTWAPWWHRGGRLVPGTPCTAGNSARRSLGRCPKCATRHGAPGDGDAENCLGASGAGIGIFWVMLVTCCSSLFLEDDKFGWFELRRPWIDQQRHCLTNKHGDCSDNSTIQWLQDDTKKISLAWEKNVRPDANLQQLQMIPI